MSLDPRRATGRFTAAGVSMFVRMLVGDRAAQNPDRIDESLQSLSEAADLLLANSALLGDLDLESEEGGKAAVERLETKKESIEWSALLVTVFAQIARDAIQENDPTKAAWATQQAMVAHAVLTFERDLKDLVWRGYGNFGADQITDALDLWEENKENSDEEFWHQALRARPFLLNQMLAAPVVIEKDKAYVGGKGISNVGGKIVDFLLRLPVVDNVVLLEIKTPATPLLQNQPYRAGVYAPSDELGGGLTQLAVYRQSLLTNVVQLAQETPLKAFSPRCALLVGRADAELIDSDRQQSFELFRRGLRDIDVVTYDELFARARSLREVLAS